MNNLHGELHNNHNVYVLGAGFSRLRGLPLMSDFMVKMRDALEYHAERGNKRESIAIKEVLSFRLKSSSAAYRVQIDLENIEELFGLASASPSNIEEYIKLAIAATLDYAAKKTNVPKVRLRASYSCLATKPNWQWDRSNLQDGILSAPAYEYIVRALLGAWWDDQTPGENTFITFNYDTILEETLKALEFDYRLGIDGKDNEKEKEKGIQCPNVFKLHGSVDWVIPKGARTQVEVKQDYRSIVNEGLTPHILPPTWRKDSRGSLNTIWNKSLQALSDATRVIVIGFSIPPTDQHFKYLLATGLQDNFSLREIVVINPSEGIELVQQRCQSLFANQAHNAAKVRFVSSTVEQFTRQGVLN